MDKKQLMEDREKLIKQFVQLQEQLAMTKGAIAYIDDNLKEEEKCPTESSPKKKK